MLDLRVMDEITIDRYRLKAFRGELSQEDLAKRSGISQSYISRLESGEKRNISLSKLGKLAQALSVPPIELIEGIAPRGVTTGAAVMTRDDIRIAVNRALGGQSTLSQEAMDRIITEIMRQEIKKASEEARRRED